MLRLASILLLLLPVMSIDASAGSAAPPVFSVYATTGSRTLYQELDPMTLEDQVGSFQFDHEWAQFAMSGDKSTFVVLEGAEIIVRNGLSGPERMRFRTPQSLFDPHLSFDGSRLIASGGLACGTGGCSQRVWYLLDLQTGAVIGKTIGQGTPVFPALVSADKARIIHAFYDRDAATPAAESRPSGPWPLRLATFDAATGTELARITLDDIEAGSWDGEWIDQVPVIHRVSPGLALSPNGSQLAVVSADLQTLLVLDSETLHIDRRLDLHEPESEADRLLRWLGLLPQSVSAKVSQGPVISAVYGAGGDVLYVTGVETDVGETVDSFTGRSFGLLEVDLATGEIAAKSLDDAQIDRVIPSPDRMWLYIVGPESPYWERNTTPSLSVLRRIDADTLEVAKERQCAEGTEIVVLAA